MRTVRVLNPAQHPEAIVLGTIPTAALGQEHEGAEEDEEQRQDEEEHCDGFH
jgi:hypothetical protein